MKIIARNRAFLGMLAGLLAGCGGSNSSIIPVANVSNPLQSTVNTTSVPPATTTSPVVTSSPVSYTGAALTTFNSVNNDRANMGVGLLVESPALDIAAQAHATYLATQNPPLETHTEVAGNPNFYADTPYDRAMKAGFTPTSAWIDESIGDVNNCYGQLMSTVYHLQELTSNVQQFGMGQVASWACVMEFATVTGTANLTQPTNGAGIPPIAGQQIPSGVLGVYPSNGQTAVPGAMAAGENPAPPLPSGYTSPGHPVLMRAAVASSTQQLVVSKFSLSDANGNGVTGVLLLTPASATASTTLPSVAAAAASSTPVAVSTQADGNIMQGVAVFVPQTVLTSGMTYTATFSGTMGTVPLSNTWSFIVK